MELVPLHTAGLDFDHFLYGGFWPDYSGQLAFRFVFLGQGNYINLDSHPLLRLEGGYDGLPTNSIIVSTHYDPISLPVFDTA